MAVKHGDTGKYGSTLMNDWYRTGELCESN